MFKKIFLRICWDMGYEMLHHNVNYIFIINNKIENKQYHQYSSIKKMAIIYFIFIISQRFLSLNFKNRMNKQNSMGVDNELSTEINESTKSYSSRFRQLKAIKSNSKCKYGEVLPFKREKAAIIIQRFWRLRNVLKKKFYEQLLEEIDQGNKLLQFQNKTIDRLIMTYHRDCQQFQAYYQALGAKTVEILQKEAHGLIKQMAVTTFKMQRKIVSQQEIAQLYQQYDEWKAKIRELELKKEELKCKLGGQIQQQQQEFLRRIKQENMNLLRVSRQKNEAQKIMRQKLIEVCKFQMNL